MSAEPNASQLRVAAQIMLMGQKWRTERWLIQQLPGTNFDLKWATIKHLKADGSLETMHDAYGTEFVRLKAEWEFVNQ